MSTSQYLLGAAELAVIAAASASAPSTSEPCSCPAWTGAPARLAEFVLGISALIVIAELLGLVDCSRRSRWCSPASSSGSAPPAGPAAAA